MIVVGCLVVLLIVIHCAAMAVWWCRIDDLDRMGIRAALRGWNQPSFRRERGLLSLTWRDAAGIVKIPYMPREYWAATTEGYFCNLIQCARSNYWPLADKLDWARMFERHGINHPTILMYNEDGNIVINREPDPSRMYLVKPTRMGCGIDISKIRGSEAHKAVESENVVVQDLMLDCRTTTVRHYRCVTLHNATIFNITQQNAPENAIISNHNQGSKASLCVGDCAPAVRELAEKLAALHAAEYPLLYSVGWDIMMHCAGDSYTAYCLEGNLRHGSWFPETLEADPGMINRYKAGLYRYLIEHKSDGT